MPIEKVITYRAKCGTCGNIFLDDDFDSNFESISDLEYVLLFSSWKKKKGEYFCFECYRKNLMK